MSASRRRRGTGISSTWCGCSCSPASIGGAVAKAAGPEGRATPPDSNLSPWRTGLTCRCPACGEGALFKGFLKVAERCPVCGVDLSAQDSGDGPAVFIVLILGFVVVALALIVEVKFEPPLWVHAIVWPPVILGGALLMLRPFKGVMIALQYKHKTHERGHSV